MKAELKEMPLHVEGPTPETGKFTVFYWGCQKATFNNYKEAKAFYDEQDEAASLYDFTAGGRPLHGKV